MLKQNRRKFKFVIISNWQVEYRPNFVTRLNERTLWVVQHFRIYALGCRKRQDHKCEDTSINSERL